MYAAFGQSWTFFQGPSGWELELTAFGNVPASYQFSVNWGDGSPSSIGQPVDIPNGDYSSWAQMAYAPFPFGPNYIPLDGPTPGYVEVSATHIYTDLSNPAIFSVSMIPMVPVSPAPPTPPAPPPSTSPAPSPPPTGADSNALFSPQLASVVTPALLPQESLAANLPAAVAPATPSATVAKPVSGLAPSMDQGPGFRSVPSLDPGIGADWLFGVTGGQPSVKIDEKTTDLDASAPISPASMMEPLTHQAGSSSAIDGAVAFQETVPEKSESVPTFAVAQESMQPEAELLSSATDAHAMPKAGKTIVDAVWIEAGEAAFGTIGSHQTKRTEPAHWLAWTAAVGLLAGTGVNSTTGTRLARPRRYLKRN
jgi:hypothetical protein